MQNTSFGNIETSSFNDLLTGQFKDAKKIILIDENVSELYLEYFITTFTVLHDAEIICIPAGEENKCLEICAQVWSSMTEYKISRKDVLINIGGGVTTDMGGFIASCYKRGIAFINIPTTLLSMVDASVGGKTGINFMGFKNQIGTFAEPEHVYIDSRFLKTLSEDEKRSGMAEMFKHGLIADQEHWNDMIQIESTDDITDTLIQKSVSIKSKVVLEDPKEANIRKTLNYGHTIGHAIESYLISQDKALPHGHCVALGMMYENIIAVHMDILDLQIAAKIESVLNKWYRQVNFTEADKKAIIELCSQDKKNENGEIRMSLIDQIGHCTYDVPVETKLIQLG